MKVTLAEVSETLSDGVILKVVRYHDSTTKRSGPPHCELVALRGDSKIRMEIETVSMSSLGAILALYKRKIEAIRAIGIPSAGNIGTVEEFVVDMAARKMFLPPILEPENS